MRDDENFAYAAAWEYKGKPSDAVLHKEQLVL
jgi:succinate dehydrogenase / fumarate reductase flavoprotein subunit